MHIRMVRVASMHDVHVTSVRAARSMGNNIALRT
jgi:hypothetical protein